MSEILAVMYVAGIAPAFVFLYWLFRDLPEEEFLDMGTVHGLVAAGLFSLLWPVVLLVMLVAHITKLPE